MPKKVKDFDIEEEFEDDTIEEDTFECRFCGKETPSDEGDDYLLICDDCGESYDIDKIWADFDSGKITEEELPTINMDKYKL